MSTFPTPPIANPPPELPAIPNMDQGLAKYLRTFALWTRRSLATKVSNTEAGPGIMLQAYDAPAGTTPPVWLLQVNSAGNFIAVRVTPGGGQP